MTSDGLEQIVKHVKIRTTTAPSIAWVAWVTRTSWIAGIADISKVAETHVDDLVLIQFANISAAEPVDMGSANLSNGVAVQRMDVRAPNEALRFSGGRIDVGSHGQTVLRALDTRD